MANQSLTRGLMITLVFKNFPKRLRRKDLKFQKKYMYLQPCFRIVKEGQRIL